MDAKDDHERDNPAHAADEKKSRPRAERKEDAGLVAGQCGAEALRQQARHLILGTKKDAGLVLYFGGYAGHKPGTTFSDA